MLSLISAACARMKKLSGSSDNNKQDNYMNKIFKRVLLVVVSIIILIIGAGLFYYFPMFLMPHVETSHVPDTDVYVLNAMSAVYLIKTGNGYIMIDAGLNTKTLQKSLNEFMIDPQNIKWIFLTHSDGDHTGGLSLFPNADIYMSEDEFSLINGTAKRTIFGGNTMPSEIDIHQINLFQDGQEYMINGVKIVCIKTPGHTIGSTVYLVDDQYLFTGDAIKNRDGKTSVHPYSMNAGLSKETIDRIMKNIKWSTILTSHYGIHNQK